MTTTTTRAIAPRRLGHGNIFVGDVSRSLAFYRDVCGLTPVFSEPGIWAEFLSNGNSHHDLAIMEARSEDRIGRGGQVQIPATVGNVPSLYHLGFEMDTEAALVDAYRHVVASNVRPEPVNHQISHSMYIADPDGLHVELYADTPTDWRDVYDAVLDELLTEQWEPLGAPPDTVPRHGTRAPRVPLVDAPLRPVRASHAALNVSDLDGSIAFYTGVVGLRVLRRDIATRTAVLAGALGFADLALVERSGAPGLHHLGFEVDVAQIDAAVPALHDLGIAVVATTDCEYKRSVVVRDPDGFLLEFAAHAALAPAEWSPTTDNERAFPL